MKKPVTNKARRSSRATLVLVDDHPLFRHGLRDAINADGRFEILGEAGDGIRALELVEHLRPRVAVLDIDMPGMSGIELASQIRRKKLDTEVVVLTMHEDEAHFTKALEAGVLGYVLKDSAAADIITCIETVLRGRNYISPSLSGHLVKTDATAKSGADKRLGVSDLTPTERKILKLVSESRSTKDIAEALFISARTVSVHRANICVKLNLHGTNALLKFALEHRDNL